MEFVGLLFFIKEAVTSCGVPCIWSGTRDNITQWVRTGFRNMQMPLKDASVSS